MLPCAAHDPHSQSELPYKWSQKYLIVRLEKNGPRGRKTSMEKKNGEGEKAQITSEKKDGRRPLHSHSANS